MSTQRLTIDEWIGEETLASDVLPHTELFYEKSTGYIYCISQKNFVGSNHANIVAYVDDFGYVSLLPESTYLVANEWEGFQIQKPLKFMQLLAWDNYRVNLEEINKKNHPDTQRTDETTTP